MGRMPPPPLCSQAQQWLVLADRSQQAMVVLDVGITLEGQALRNHMHDAMGPPTSICWW
jgi:hypothetical protein